MSTRPAWLEIDTDAITHNVKLVRDFVGAETKVLAVVKANGYGHGLVEAAEASLRGGAAMLGVAILDEAAALRDAGITAPILVMGPVLPEEAEDAVSLGCQLVVADVDTPIALSSAAQKLGRTVSVHLKVDTGMNRVGVRPEDAGIVGHAIANLPGIQLVGLCSHLATGEEDLGFVIYQLGKLQQAEEELRKVGIAPVVRHLASSASTAACPQTWLDMVRIGLLVYGIPAGGAFCPSGLRPALSLKARLTQVKRARSGCTVGYGRTYTLTRDSVLGVVPLGYADGFPFHLSNRGRVLVRGRWANVLGRVCMDQFVVDLTDIPEVRVGDEVVVIGRQGTRSQTVADLAERSGSISHAILAGLSTRLPRRFIRTA